jgi:hypothetical protein
MLDGLKAEAWKKGSREELLTELLDLLKILM